MSLSQRPPWQEEGIPDNWSVLYDDGDVVAINKPSGIPVNPVDGFLIHILTQLMKEYFENTFNSIYSKPFHRLGRYTSGLILCARSSSMRAQLSKQFQESTMRSSYMRKNILPLAIECLVSEEIIQSQFHQI